MDVIIFGGQSNMQGQTGALPEVNEAVAAEGTQAAIDEAIAKVEAALAAALEGQKA